MQTLMVSFSKGHPAQSQLILSRTVLSVLNHLPSGFVNRKNSEIIRLGLTPDSRSVCEDRTFPITGTLNGSSSWNDCTK